MAVIEKIEITLAQLLVLEIDSIEIKLKRSA